MGENENRAVNADEVGQICPDCLRGWPSWRLWIAIILVSIAGATLDLGEPLSSIVFAVVVAIVLGVEVLIDLRRGNFRILRKAEIKRELRVTGFAFLLAIPVTAAVVYFELWVEMLLGLPLLAAIVAVIAKVKERKLTRRIDH